MKKILSMSVILTLLLMSQSLMAYKKSKTNPYSPRGHKQENKQEKKDDAWFFPGFPTPDSSGFNLTSNIGEVHDSMIVAGDQEFYFKPDEVEVTDVTGRLIKLNSITPPADAQLLVVDKDERGRNIIARIRITALYTEEWEPRSLDVLVTDTRTQQQNQSAPPAPSGKAAFGSSHNNGEK